MQRERTVAGDGTRLRTLDVGIPADGDPWRAIRFRRVKGRAARSSGFKREDSLCKALLAFLRRFKF